MDKESSCNAGGTGDTGSIPELGKCPGGGHGDPLQNSCQENPMEPGGLQPMGHKESDMIEGPEPHMHKHQVMEHLELNQEQ